MYEAPIAMTPYQYFDNVLFNFLFFFLITCLVIAASLPPLLSHSEAWELGHMVQAYTQKNYGS